ncbi:MAG TPA: HWE histidine kinase domain-containing protein [Azospirillaceae bacterium]|nr:HWE histidine kinase domain-containing protein [Azospirillaceae bacterium]
MTALPHSTGGSRAASPPFLAGGGEMGGRIRAHDWALTPLGPPERWPETLRVMVPLMLESRQPTVLFWGPARTLLYNDAYAPLMGARHPHALGRPFAEVWHEILDEIGPIMDRAFAGTAVHMDDIRLVLLRNGYPEETHFSFSYTPVRDAAGGVAGVFCTCLETTGTVQAVAHRRFQTALLERIRSLVDATEIMAAASEMLGRELGVAQVGYSEVEANGEFIAIARDWSDGRIPSVVGRHRLGDFGERIKADLHAGREIEIRDVAADPRTAGAPTAAAFAALSIRAVLAVPLIKRGRLFATLFVHHAEPRVWSDADRALAREVAERTWGAVSRARADAARAEAERRQVLLMREVDHRAKNALAVVQTVVRLTRAATQREFLEAVEGRIAALARAHSLLANGRWSGAGLRALAAEELDPYVGDGRGEAVLDGPDVALAPDAVQPTAMVLHELATNAAKYGALSHPGGRVRLSWSPTPDGGLELEWREEDGPPLAGPPGRQGFGSEMVAAAATQLGGTARFDWDPSGLRCRLSMAPDALSGATDPGIPAPSLSRPA